MPSSYSQAFHDLIKEDKSVENLIAGCGAGGGSLELWEARRQFIADAFHKSGTVFDIGCGNGFLLRCLQEWSGVDLIPYGIDTDNERIEKAKNIFPIYSDHFLTHSLEGLWNNWPTKFPETFDFIYCSLWGRRKFETDEARTTLERLWKRVSDSGHLILGFYGTNRFSPESEEHTRERETLMHLTQCVKNLGFQIAGKSVAEGQMNNIAIWIAKTS